MDAVLESLEAKSSEVQADSRVKADQFIADLHKKRDESQESVKQQANAGETAWLRAKSQLENTWNGFETEVKRYIETFGKQIEHQCTAQRVSAGPQMHRLRAACGFFARAGGELLSSPAFRRISRSYIPSAPMGDQKPELYPLGHLFRGQPIAWHEIYRSNTRFSTPTLGRPCCRYPYRRINAGTDGCFSSLNSLMSA